MANFELNVKVNGIEQTVSSIGELEKALAETKKQLQGVEAGSKEFKFLENQARNLDKVMVGLTGDAKVLNGSLKDINTTAGVLNNSLQDTVEVSQQIGGSAGAKNLNEDIKVASNSSQSLRLELRKITQELQGLEPGSARFQELSQRAGALRDQISDTSAVIGSLAGSSVERLGRALTTTTQIGIAGFQGIVAAQALLGTENEELNRTLVKLTALLNLSQALTTFGGLGDKITELKAGFASLFPAAVSAASGVTATAVATEGEAVASGQAAVATSGFAIALNALPLVAIVTALGLVVAGLISYASAESDAEKADEKRKKQLEALKKSQEAQNEAIKKSSEQFAGQVSGFISLNAQIRNSIPGSKERLQLIKESNATYGTTLKNLKDEKFFQDQVTKSVADFIAFSRAKFKLTQNEKAIEAEFTKQQVALTKLSSSLGILDKSQKNYITNFAKQVESGQALVGNLDILKAGFLQQGKQFQILQNDVFDYLGAIGLANSSIDNLGGTITTLKQQLNDESNALFRAAEGNKTNTKETDRASTAADNYTQTLKGLLEFQEKADSEEEKLAKKRVERTESKLDDLEFERDIVLSKIIQEYTAEKKAIEDNVKDETERKQLLQNLETTFALRTKIVNTELYEDLEQQQKDRVTNQKKFIEDLTLAEKILQDEITFGNNNTNDSLIALEIRRKQIEIDRLEREQNDLINFSKIEADKRLLLEQSLDLQLQLEREKADAERTFQITEILNYYKSLKQFNIDFNEETGVATVKVTDKYLAEQFKANELFLKQKKASGLISEEDFSSQLIALNAETVDKVATEAEKTEKVINKSAINLTEEANVKKLESDAKYNKAKVDLSKKSDAALLEELGNTIDKINEIFGLFANQLSGLFTAITESNRLELDQQLADTQRFYDEKNVTTQNSFDAEKKALNENLTSGQISQEQYNAAISNLDIQRTAQISNNERQLNAELLTQRQKSFDKEKKLKKAQALLSGFQGALTAFTSAFQLGPIAGPIVGAILAGLVVATTAKQVQNIENTKLDGGGLQSDTSLTSTQSPSIPAGNSLPTGGGFTAFTEGAGSPPGFVPSTPFSGTANGQRVYVVESDITEAQSRVKVLEGNSTFG